MDNFDVTDSINYNFENWINIDRFIDFLKREKLFMKQVYFYVFVFINYYIHYVARAGLRWIKALKKL